MSKKKIKDVAVRAFKTFWQAAIGCIVGNLTGIISCDGNTVKTVLSTIAVSAIACGVCATWNGVLSPLFNGGVKDE